MHGTNDLAQLWMMSIGIENIFSKLKVGAVLMLFYLPILRYILRGSEIHLEEIISLFSQGLAGKLSTLFSFFRSLLFVTNFRFNSKHKRRIRRRRIDLGLQLLRKFKGKC